MDSGEQRWAITLKNISTKKQMEGANISGNKNVAVETHPPSQMKATESVGGGAVTLCSWTRGESLPRKPTPRYF